MNDNDMNDSESKTASRRKQRLAGAVGLLLAGGLAGGLLAATTSASAADPATTSAAGQSAAVPAAGDPAAPADTATSVRPGEKALTGADQATAKAAALKAVPGGTVFRVETDADGATYEAHMTKTDGTRVTVKFDKSFKVTEIQEGMGKR
jgi:ABC-type transport system substrate-binding protein